MNGDVSDFAPTKETFGITSLSAVDIKNWKIKEAEPLTEPIRRTVVQEMHINLLPVRIQKQYKTQYSFLGSVQGVLYAVVPVHTAKEQELFNKIMLYSQFKSKNLTLKDYQAFNVFGHYLLMARLFSTKHQSS